jgi:hypothetical protein
MCGDVDGGMKDLEEEDRGEDQRMSSSSSDLFSVRGRTVVDVNVFRLYPLHRRVIKMFVAGDTNLLN